MSSEAFQKKAQAINEASTLITRLSNFQSAVRDFDRLRLDGARFLSPEDEEFQEFMADLDGICTMASGPAGVAVRAEMRDAAPIDRLCGGGKDSLELDENDLRALGGALERALARAQESLQKVLIAD